MNVHQSKPSVDSMLRKVELCVSRLRNDPGADPRDRLRWIEEASQTLLDLEDLEVNRASVRGQEVTG
jgi:hypothetical protein